MWNEDLGPDITSSSQPSGPESFSSMWFEAIIEQHNVCINESDLLSTRGKRRIFKDDKFLAERQTRRRVKPVGGNSDHVNLPSCQ